jgi:predicted nucleic acid-binding protein
MTALVDTDVMIDFLRGQAQAVAFMQAVPLPVHVSAITVAELFAGVREGEEKAALDTALTACRVHPLTADIAMRGGLWRRDYGRSHGVGLADALIAATAEHAGLDLVTLNARHYPMLERISIPYRKN